MQNFILKSEGDSLGDLYVDGRMILKLILMKYRLKELTGFIWLMIGSGVVLL
jgi:hypothetical protein